MEKIGIILGSGLNELTYNLSSPMTIYKDSKGIHKKKIEEGVIFGKNAVVFSGRTHFYESNDNKRVLFNITLAKELGIKSLLISNAAGGLNSSFNISDLMLITSYINLIPKRIIDSKNKTIFEGSQIEKISDLAFKNGIHLKKGTYLALPGPTYETSSEIRFLKKTGADAVGMSTIPEIIFAKSIGIDIVSVSIISNLLNPTSNNPLSHNDVINAGRKANDKFEKLLKIILNDY